jgi:hypothetical protein
MLIEFLVYLLLFSIITLATTGMVARLWIPTMHYTKKQTCRIDLITAHDCLAYDIKKAKSERKFWKMISSNRLIFPVSDHDIGWLMQNGNLVRIEGTFNLKEGIWNNPVKSLIVKDIQSITFDVQGDSIIQYVSFIFTKADEQIKGEIGLINRALPWKIKKK